MIHENSSSGLLHSHSPLLGEGLGEGENVMRNCPMEAVRDGIETKETNPLYRSIKKFPWNG